ncbi:hypothetical protein [Limosilactobacillus sp.]|uniref:hypothetical protein n=1 Tax=Limosilactobacillus sp. TaxID=2773925 RepID=UPI00345E5164
MNIRQTAPWPIPPDAQGQWQTKHGYCQIKYSWRQAGWRYEARWHERIRYAAVRYNHGQATTADIQMLRAAHPVAVAKPFPGK